MPTGPLSVPCCAKGSLSMSAESSRAEGQRWLVTARYDLDAARLLADNGMFSLACFHCQQAAEKALKAMHYAAGLEPWGHSVAKLIADLIEQRQDIAPGIAAAQDDAARLDQFYIPTRYPNGIPDIPPSQAFRRKDADAGLDIAQRIVAAAEALVGNL
jgi:HEPN domain-containing protein